jgi:hypothetical protein
MKFKYNITSGKIKIRSLHKNVWFNIIPIFIKTAIKDEHRAFAICLESDGVRFRCDPIYDGKPYRARYGLVPDSFSWIGTDIVELL